jgi:hypothetical protein
VLRSQVLTVVCACLAPLAFAKITRNTIDPVAIVSDNGRHIKVTGRLRCLAPLAFARIARNTFDPVAIVSDNGRHIKVAGAASMPCTTGLRKGCP